MAVARGREAPLVVLALPQPGARRGGRGADSLSGTGTRSGQAGLVATYRELSPAIRELDPAIQTR